MIRFKIMTYEKKLHCCPHNNCNSSFDRPSKLAQHILLHDNIRPYTCPEENCTKSYTNKSHLNRHINTVHKVTESDILYSCPKCMKRYANRQNLKRHIKIIHILKIPFSCDICKLEFKKKNQLSAHMYQHTGIKAFSCELCQKEFVTLYEKKRHIRFHNNYSCEDCLMQFNHWSKYQKHRKTEHISKEYICNECGRSFKQRGHIVRHVKIHSESYSKNRMFPCPYVSICQRLYSRNSNLKHHILTKHENMTFECTLCKAQLSSKAKLNDHIKRHDRDVKENKVKTKVTGRKERKDKGSFKMSTALKLAGISETLLKKDDSEVLAPNSTEVCVAN